MTERRLVVTYLGTLVAVVVGLAAIAMLAAGVAAVAGSAADAAGAVAGAATDAAAAVGDLVAGPSTEEDPSAAGDGEDGAGDGAGEDAGVDDGNGSTAPSAETDAAATETEDEAPGAETAAATATTGDGSAAGNGSATNATEPVEHETVNVSTVEDRVLARVNGLRADKFVSDLDHVYREELWQIAEYHVDDMIADGYVGTVAPDGEDKVDRFDRFSPTCKRVEEYTDAVSLAARLNYSTRVGHPDHGNASRLATRVVAAWDANATITDDTYSDVGLDVRHVNDTDGLYAAAAIC